MAIHELLGNSGQSIRNMVKGNGHIKRFRNQSVALIRISRELLMNLDNSNEHNKQLEGFLETVNSALEVIRNEKLKTDQVNQSLNKVKEDLQSYVKLVWGQDSRDYEGQLKAAEASDKERAHKILSLEPAKKIFTKSKVKTDFMVYEGNHTSFTSHGLCEDSTIEEVIFKFSRNVPKNRISLLDNAHFYDGFSGEFLSPKDFGIDSNGKKAIESLGSILKRKKKDMIHVAVELNPRIRVMCVTADWSLSFSVVLYLTSKSNVVLKGVDGTLHSSQEVERKLLKDNAVGGEWIFWPVDKAESAGRSKATFDLRGWSGRLREIKDDISKIKHNVSELKQVPSWIVKPPSRLLIENLQWDLYVAPSIRPRLHTSRPTTPVFGAGRIDLGKSAASTSQVSRSSTPAPEPPVGINGPGGSGQIDVKKTARALEDNEKKPEKKWMSFWRSK